MATPPLPGSTVNIDPGTVQVLILVELMIHSLLIQQYMGAAPVPDTPEDLHKLRIDVLRDLTSSSLQQLVSAADPTTL